jgi:hypothetical protein
MSTPSNAEAEAAMKDVHPLTDVNDHHDDGEDGHTIALSNQLSKLWNGEHGETISVTVHIEADEEEALKQALGELALLSGIQKDNDAHQNQQDATSSTGSMTDDEFMSRAVRESRYGKFPFARFVRDEATPPTPLDLLVMDAGILSLVQQAFTVCQDCNHHGNHSAPEEDTDVVQVYPRLVDARVVSNVNLCSGNSENRDRDSTTMETTYRKYWNMIHSGKKQDNNTNTLPSSFARHLLLVTVPLSFCDRIKWTNIQMAFLDPQQQAAIPITGATTSQSTRNISVTAETTNAEEDNQSSSTIQVGLKLLFRDPRSTSYLEGGDAAFIRYLEHGQTWMARMRPLQRSALGVPPPGHAYWTNKNSGLQALQQLKKRHYGGDEAMSAMDLMEPYYNKPQSINTVAPPPKFPTPQPPNGANERHPDKTYLEPTRWVEPDDIQTTAQESVDASFISPSQMKQFQDEGYLFLHGVFPPPVLEDGIAAANQLWPANNDDATAETSAAHQHACHHHRYSARDFAFPFRDDRLNQMTLESRLLSVVQQLLGVQTTSAMRIMQSACFAKRGTPTVAGDGDGVAANGENEKNAPVNPGNQPMHWDFGSNTLLTPSRCPSHWADNVEEVQVIDVCVCCAVGTGFYSSCKCIVLQTH